MRCKRPFSTRSHLASKTACPPLVLRCPFANSRSGRDGGEYVEARITETIVRNASVSPEAVLETIFEDVNRVCDTLSDDATCVVIVVD